MGMKAALKYRVDEAVGHGPENPKFTSKLFKTNQPAHAVGLIDLMAQVVGWCHKHAIHQYEEITITRDEPIR